MELLRALTGPEGSVHLTWEQECVRAFLVFLIGIAFMRLSGKRTFARGSPLDIVVTVIIGSNLSRAMTGGTPFMPTLVASGLLVALHRVLTHACRQWPVLDGLFKGKPVKVIEHGVVDRAGLRREGKTAADLLAALRLKRADGPEDVRLAMLENSGDISVLKR